MAGARRLVAVPVLVALLAACHPAPGNPTSTTAATPASSGSVSTTATTPPARPDQSAVFFPPSVDDYGLDLTQVDRDHLAELHALRQIDPYADAAHADGDLVAPKFLTGDPCTAAREVNAVGFTWRDPAVQVQYNTTWRHPGVCKMRLSADTGAGAPGAGVKYGLTRWSDDTASDPGPNGPTRSEQDGVQLFEETNTYEDACWSSVVAKSNVSIEPVTVGAAAPEVTAPTPVVSITLKMPTGSDCGAVAKRAAVAAVQRTT